MARYIATIQVLIEAADEGEACDVMSETIRPLLQEFGADSAWIDWQYALPNYRRPQLATKEQQNEFEYA